MAPTTGLPNLDRILQGIRSGDNIVWQMDAIEDFVPLADAFASSALARGERLTYFRFGEGRELVPRDSSTCVASATVCNMVLANGIAAGPTMGILDVSVDGQHQQKGLATFLMSEVFRQLAEEGVCTVEGHVAQQNVAAVGLFRKFALEEIERGTVFHKDVSAGLDEHDVNTLGGDAPEQNAATGGLFRELGH